MLKRKSSKDKISTVSESTASYRTAPYSGLRVILGGSKNVKAELSSEMDMVILSRQGLPKRTLGRIASLLGISMEGLSSLLHISHRTLQRKADSDLLSVHISEQVISIANVINRGLEVFGSEEAFKLWIHSEIPSINFMKPVLLLDTSFGSSLVLRMMGRIEHGVY